MNIITKNAPLCFLYSSTTFHHRNPSVLTIIPDSFCQSQVFCKTTFFHVRIWCSDILLNSSCDSHSLSSRFTSQHVPQNRHPSSSIFLTHPPPSIITDHNEGILWRGLANHNTICSTTLNIYHVNTVSHVQNDFYSVVERAKREEEVLWSWNKSKNLSLTTKDLALFPCPEISVTGKSNSLFYDMI